MTIGRTAAAVAIVLGSWPAAIVLRVDADQDVLARAKALYISAAYDEALALLNQAEHGSTNDHVEADQYRAFCLLALGRSDDARQVIEHIVETNPTFQPSETQVSPRLQDAFREVRRRVLPSIVRQTYADAKAAFDRNEFEAAGRRFIMVVTLLDDGDTQKSGELSDLRMLSNGFLDLIKKIPPPQAAPAPAAPPPPLPQVPAAPTAPVVYDARDPGVTPPVVVSQEVPPWHPTKQEARVYDATLTLVIDEHGDVASVALEGNLHPGYVQLLRRAAARWKYQPATKGGVPVKYRRAISIHLAPNDANRPVRDQG